MTQPVDIVKICTQVGFECCQWSNDGTTWTNGWLVLLADADGTLIPRGSTMYALAVDLYGTGDLHAASYVTDLDGVALNPQPTHVRQCLAPTDPLPFLMCDNGLTTFVRWLNPATGAVVSDRSPAGLPYVTVGAVTAGQCPTAQSSTIADVCVRLTAAPTADVRAFRKEVIAPDGTSTVTFWGTDGAEILAADIATWKPGLCGSPGPDVEETVWCVNGVPLIRRSLFDVQAGTYAITWYDSANNPAAPTAPQITAATPGRCGPTMLAVAEVCVQTVAAPTVNVKAFRRESVAADGTVTVTFVAADGAAIVPGTWQPGACSTCCPISLGTVCWSNAGVTGRAFAVFDPITSTTTYYDVPTGAVVAAANVNTCFELAEVRLYDASNAAPWTPAAIPAGRVLTSMSFTVLTGTASVTDAGGTTVAALPAGYSASWGTSDIDQLTAPQNITPAAGGRAVVAMTTKTP